MAARDRNKQKQIWSDREFAEILKNIKLKKELKLGGEKVSIADITKDIKNAPSFKNIEKEILGDLKGDIKVRLDKKRLFG